MIALTTALHWEAKPLIKRFGLRKVREHTNFEIFASDEYSLVITGIGKVSAAIATTYLLSSLEHQPSLVCNIGLCGAREEFSIGELLAVSSLQDRGKGKAYFPEMIVKHDFREARLGSFKEE